MEQYSDSFGQNYRNFWIVFSKSLQYNCRDNRLTVTEIRNYKVKDRNDCLELKQYYLWLAQRHS